MFFLSRKVGIPEEHGTNVPQLPRGARSVMFSSGVVQASVVVGTCL